MRRLSGMLKGDLLLLKRYGICYAASFVALVWIAALFPLSAALKNFLLPFVIFVDLAVLGFYFFGAMVLFDKGQNTIQALVVTPLRVREYFISKIVALSAVSLAMSVLVAWAVYGPGIRPAVFIPGVLLNSVLFTLLGFIAISRYDSITDYLLPSALYLTVFQLPLIDYFNLVPAPWFHWAMFAHPTQGALVLIAAAFDGRPAFEPVLGTVAALVWIAVLFPLSEKAFRKYIVRQQG